MPGKQPSWRKYATSSSSCTRILKAARQWHTDPSNQAASFSSSRAGILIQNLPAAAGCVQRAGHGKVRGATWWEGLPRALRGAPSEPAAAAGNLGERLPATACSSLTPALPISCACRLCWAACTHQLQLASGRQVLRLSMCSAGVLASTTWVLLASAWS